MDTAAHEKYQFKPFKGSSHFWALNELTKLSPESRILDIGSGSGAIGKELQTQGFKNLHAVEVDDASRQLVEPFYSRTYENLGSVTDKDFDVIILLDVLEHIADAKTFLSAAVKHLKQGGLIFISLPNVAHWSVRLPLLFGYFEYQNRGIMDRTHLHFYTRKTAKAFIKSMGNLELKEESSSVEPLEFVLPKAIWDNNLFSTLTNFRLSVANMLPGLMSYQHLFLVRKL